MSFYSDYAFEVKADHPSGLPQYQSGKASATRRFLVNCQYAEEFALRQIGKYHEDGIQDMPFLPAPFPFSLFPFGFNDKIYGQLNLVATSFSIEAVTSCCFNVSHETFSGTSDLITDPVSLNEMEKYWREYPEGMDNSECLCRVTITYEENPCDCVFFNQLSGLWETADHILENTCISVERNPAYEMFTLPNGNLVWADLPAGPDRRLKADSYAYKIIPKADIIVSWHNVPVNRICAIETHLAPYRGTVNLQEWGSILSCDYDPGGSETAECSDYDDETLLFVDWQEDRNRRTDAFGGMRPNIRVDNRNTTTLKLIFKQKRIVDGANIRGWNHLFFDRTVGTDTWERVQLETGEDLFEAKDFTDILNPDL
jgi:hypothetical protein